MLTDAQWAVLEPLIEAVRPAAKVPPQHLRRTISAIVWRHDNGAKWRAVPATRYEKTANSFMGVLCLAAAIDWIKC